MFISRYLEPESSYLVFANLLLGMLIMVALHCLLTAIKAKEKNYLYLGLFFVGALINAVSNLYNIFIIQTIEPYIGSWIMMAAFILFIESYLSLPATRLRTKIGKTVLSLCLILFLLSITHNVINGRVNNIIILIMDISTVLLLVSLFAFLLYNSMKDNKRSKALLILELTIILGGLSALGIFKSVVIKLGILPVQVLQGNFIFLIGMTVNGFLFSYLLSLNLVTLKIQTALSESKNSELRELDRVKTEFIMNMSHEFRTPLTVIGGIVKQLIQGKWGDSIKTNIRHLEIIERNNKRLLKQVSNLLQLSGMQSNSRKLVFISISLKEFLESLEREFQIITEQQNIEFRIQSLSEEIILQADLSLLQTAMINLVSNAVKFTQAHGTIILGAFTTNEKIHIFVQDTGKGIPESDQKLIYQRFHQVESLDRPVYQGTGIGLSLVWEVMSQHKGIVELISEENKGSVFTLVFPVRPELDQVSTVSPTQITENNLEIVSALKSEIMERQVLDSEIKPFSVVQNNGFSVLLVEDNKDLTEYIRNELQPYFQFNSVGNGKKAISWLTENTPDLIISDIMMPVMNGHQLLDELKMNEKTQNIPVIFLTARDSEIEKIESLKKGVVDYMDKPFSSEILIAKITNTIKRNAEYKDQYNTSFKKSLVNWIENFSDSRDVSVNSSLDQISPIAKLTNREQEIEALIRQGLSDKEIAASLGLSAKTIGNYNSSIFRKFGVSGRLELITQGMKVKN
jgi:signal transduction histidine kinase/DNA-binding NarL/FixJ family response regulator